MTTYNGERFLAAQLDSVVRQTYADFELIICDDCSTDHTPSILAEYARNDRRVKIFKNRHNLGFKKNFEKAMQLCSGDYIAFCDQDDIWTEHHLAVLLSGIEDSLLICGNNLLVTENGVSLERTFFESNCFSNAKYKTTSDILQKIIYSGNCFQGASMLMKKELLKYVLPFPDMLPYHDAWCSTAACFLNRFTYTDTVVTHYRQHENQVTNNERQAGLTVQQRLYLCKEIELRNLCMISDGKIILHDAYNFFSHADTFASRLHMLPLWSRKYAYIHPNGNVIKKYPHMIKFLFYKRRTL